MQYLCLLIFVLTSIKSCLAKPFMWVGTTEWDENLTIFVGNCVEGGAPKRGKMIKPTTHWQKESIILDGMYEQVIPVGGGYFNQELQYQKFQEKLKARPAFMYVIANTTEGAILYRLNGHTGEEDACFQFSVIFQTASVVTQAVKIANDWQMFLVVVGTVEGKEASTVYFFEVTDPKQDLKPIKILNDKWDLKFNILSKPYLVRMQNTHWYLVSGGYLETSGAIGIMSLQEEDQSFFIKTGESGAITSLAPLDVEGKGVVSQIAAYDSLGNIWSWGFLDLQNNQRQKLAKLNLTHFDQTLWVQKEGNGTGLRLNLLVNNTANQPQAMSLTYKIEDNTLKTKSAVLQEGKFQSILPRFGRIILIPDDLESTPIVLSQVQQGWLPVKRSWETLISEGSRSKGVAEAKMLWDKKQSRDILVRMNHRCELSIVTTDINCDKHGRVAWRMMREQSSSTSE